MASDGSALEGMLYKWTNYWGGWQPRWFVLNHCILAYYSSLEEMDKGCKASVNVSAGELKVHPTDLTRFDIILQHDQHWYLRASSTAERQKWLIAIGSAKAGSAEKWIIQEKESAEAMGELQTKISELRLYCDLLISQVEKVKEEAKNEHPAPEKLTETSSMLSVTCDTFIATLSQCLTIAESSHFLPSPVENSNSHSFEDRQMALSLSDVRKSRHRKRRGTRSVSVDDSRTSSTLGTDSPSSLSGVPEKEHRSVPTTPLADTVQHNILMPDGNEVTLAQLKLSNTPIPDRGTLANAPPEVPSPYNIVKTEQDQTLTKDSNSNCTKPLASPSRLQEHQLTFFTAMLHSFTDIVLEEDGGVPTSPFLAACDNLLPFFDIIGSKAFAPVKMDLNGNIRKIRTKQESDSASFTTLQSIVQREMDTSTTKVRNSATDALMWLNRALRFMQKFLINMKNGERDLPTALNQAYAVTLKRYHGWVVKGIFALAVKAAPYHDDFIRALGTDGFGSEDPGFYDVLMQDMDQYVTAIEVVLNIVDNFYERQGLESDAVV